MSNSALNHSITRRKIHKMRHYNADYFSIALKMTQKIINIYNRSCIRFHNFCSIVVEKFWVTSLSAKGAK